METRRIRVECLHEDCGQTTLLELSQAGANGSRRAFSARLLDTGWRMVGHTPDAVHFACPRHAGNVRAGSGIELNAPAFFVSGTETIVKMLEMNLVQEALALAGELRETADRLLKQYRLWQEAGVVVPAGLGWMDLLRREVERSEQEEDRALDQWMAEGPDMNEEGDK